MASAWRKALDAAGRRGRAEAPKKAPAPEAPKKASAPKKGSRKK